METRNCQNCKNDFTIDTADFSFYEKIRVPPPTFCPTCRLQRRMMIRNEHILYKRKCDLTGQDIVTIFSPEKQVRVFHRKVWWSDDWDQYQHGMEYDPSRNFFEQFRELQMKTPWPNLITDGDIVNSEYINHAGSCKDCYLIFNADFCENVLYGTTGTNSCDSMDIVFFNKMELCYEVVDGNGTKVCFSENCDECLNVYFSKDCVGCSNCFGCVNLRKKQYCMWNEQLTKEEYEKKFKEYQLDKHSVITELRKKAYDFWLTFPKKYYHGRQNVNSTGDYIYYTKNARDCFYTIYAEDSRYCSFITSPTTKDCYDISEWGANLESSYESVTAGADSQGVKFCFSSWAGADNTEYCMMTPGSRNCFGCCNMKKAEYCILNKQYTKEEYFKLRAQIIEDMTKNPYVDSKGRVFTYGEFFPYDLSMFDYNESWAMDYFPLTKEQALGGGFRWHEDIGNKHTPTIQANDLPDSIHDVEDAILKEIIGCSDCGKVYRIVVAELQLLRRFGFPIPHKCPHCRQKDRILRINPPKLYERTTEDGVEVLTAYAPDHPEKILSEEAYQKLVM